MFTKVEKNISYNQFLEVSEGIFFKNGISSKGTAEKMEFQIGNYQGHIVPEDTFNMSEI